MSRLASHTVAAGVAAGVAAVAAVACSAGPGAAGSEPVTIAVLAAASLSDAFAEIGEQFSAAEPGIDVRYDLGSSSGLARRILDGAPGEVFASADLDTMATVVAGGEAAGEPSVFAHNFLEIAAAPGNPEAVSGLADLARQELLVGVCAKEVPCGRLARRLLAAGGVVPAIDTHEPDVRSLVTKIEEGELDAGLVYHSDVVASGGRVDAVGVPGADELLTSYPIVALAGASTPDQAAAFVDFVLSDAGQEILARHGFLGR